MRKERVELAAAIRTAVETSRPLIEARGHELSLSLPDRSVPLYADPTRLAQVFANLLNNAAKFTEPGGRIWLHSAVENGAVVVSVRDTGIGIPGEMLSRVFDLFTQVDSSISRRHDGLGIGLSLVKALVEMHEGTIEAHARRPGTTLEQRLQR